MAITLFSGTGVLTCPVVGSTTPILTANNYAIALISFNIGFIQAGALQDNFIFQLATAAFPFFSFRGETQGPGVVSIVNQLYPNGFPEPLLLPRGSVINLLGQGFSATTTITYGLNIYGSILF
jgi:hypothetical protein